MSLRLLILVRHAEAERPTARMRDFDRALTPTGRAQAERAGRWLAGHVSDTGLAVLVSPARRARQTAARMLDGWYGGRITEDARIWDATAGDLLAVTADAGGERLMLVGHNPGIEQLQYSLTGVLAPVPVGSIHVIALSPERGAHRTAVFSPNDDQ